MAKGKSDRVVIELAPGLKQELYSALEKEGLNLKQWFTQSAEDYLKNRSQMNLQLVFNDGNKDE